MFMSFQKISQALGKAVSVKDAFFNYVSLLINTTTTNGAQNNTFLDSSSNAIPITRNGLVSQGTFSPFSQTSWSAFVNGQNNYFETTTNSPLATGTTTFTIETWLYMTAVPTTTGYMGMMSASEATGANGAWFFGPNSTRYLKWDWFDGLNIQSTTSTTTLMELGTWYHVAISVNANAITMYVNGVPQSLTGTTTLSNRSGNYPLVFGQWDTNASYFFGYVSNTRIISGQSLFSGAFTPATTPLTLNTVGATGAGAAASITGSVLFLGNQNNRYLDNSVSALKFNRYGTAAIQNFSPFAPTVAYSTSNIGGSGYSSANTTFLSNSTFNTTATGDFTVEAWAYFNNLALGDNAILSLGNENTGRTFFSVTNNGLIRMNVFGQVNFNFGPNGSILPNTWNHIAWVRSGTTSNNVTAYVNGTSVGSARYIQNVGNTGGFLVSKTTAGNLFSVGYISNLRVTIGSAVYTGNFTTPTAPFTASMAANPFGGTNTIAATATILLNYANSGIYDASTKNNLITVGGANVSTAQAKFSNASIVFDGSGDYVPTTPVTVVNSINNANCTLEMWVYSTNSSGALKCLIDTRSAQGTNTGYGVYQTGNNVVIYGNGVKGNAANSLVGNTWTHLAVTRAGSNNFVFLNGTLFNTFSYGDTLTSGNVTIGSDAARANAFTGFIEQVRITNGIARYTNNFSVPTTVFPVQ